MNIVVLDGFTLNPGDNPWTDIAALGPLVVHDRTSPDVVVERARNADIVLTNKTPLSAAMLSALPGLRFVGVLATGFNVVDTAAARARSIPVSNVPIYGTDTVAEFVFALVLDFWRQPRLHSELVKQGAWGASRDFCFWRTPQVELAGQTIGLVGFGRIGRRVGELAAAFKMKVLVAGPVRNGLPDLLFEQCEVAELFARADIVSLHCRLTPENTGMVNRSLLARMKPEAFLVNTARGALINEADLAAALNAGWLAGAALDVVSLEPVLPDNPLLHAKNVTLTPHIAWAALAARRRLMKTTVQNITAFLAGSPINVVN